MVETIAIVGCGLIGQAWTISFARAGKRIQLWDATKNVAHAMRDGLASALDELESYGLLESAPEELLARIDVCDTLEDALQGVEHVQENTPEDIEVKRAVFAQLDEIAHCNTVLASSTSALLPSKFTEELAGRDRCIVIHPINPPHLIPAVEIVPSQWTSTNVITSSADLMNSIGQLPIVMKKELDGFIMNRLQGALIEEAFRLVDGGYASAEDVDIGIREGLALRWSFMGPFETIDLNAPGGVRDYVERYNEMYRGIAESAVHRVDWTGTVLGEVENSRRDQLGLEQLTERRAWRDRRLMALIAHKRTLEKEQRK